MNFLAAVSSEKLHDSSTQISAVECKRDSFKELKPLKNFRDSPNFRKSHENFRIKPVELNFGRFKVVHGGKQNVEIKNVYVAAADDFKSQWTHIS